MFSDNAIQCIEIVINENSKLINQELYQVKIPDSIINIGIMRAGKFIMANSDEFIKANDHIFYLGTVEDQSILEKSFDLTKEIRENKVMLVGGSDIALEIAFE